MTKEEALINLTSNPTKFPNVDVWGSLSVLSGIPRQKVKEQIFKSFSEKGKTIKVIRNMIPLTSESALIAANIISWVESINENNH